jgi:hypothetical protein
LEPSEPVSELLKTSLRTVLKAVNGSPSSAGGRAIPGTGAEKRRRRQTGAEAVPVLGVSEQVRKLPETSGPHAG